MASSWFSESFTNFQAQIPDTSELSYQEVHAKNIFEKYFIVDKPTEAGSAINAVLYGKDRITQEWLTTVLRRGTSTDRVLALAYLVKSRPISSLRHLDSLLAFVSPAKKHTCLKAIDVLTNLLDTILLPKKRALIAFENRPFDQLKTYPQALAEDLSLKVGGSTKGSSLPHLSREYVLSMWYFENQLKQFYFRFLTSLENVLMTDTIQAEKTRALNALITMASKKPENRETAFSILVNKLGDRSKAFASNVIYKLRIMCQEQWSLKAIIVEQLRSLLFRPNLLERAKYYAIVLLSCIPLSKTKKKMKTGSKDTQESGDADIASILFKVYLSFFRASVEADELPERLVTALLAGSSRVAPYLSEEVISENLTDIDAVFRLVHITTNFNISLQALSFLFNFTDHQPQLRDRYYQALYRKLNDPAIRWSSRGPSLLNLIYRSLLGDRDDERRAAILQRLLSVCLDHPNPGFVAGTQILLEKLRVAKKITPTLSADGVKTSSTASKGPRSLLPTAIGIVKPAQNTPGGDSDEEHFSDVAASDEDDEAAHKDAHEAKSSGKIAAPWDHRHLLKKCSYAGSSADGYNAGVRDPRFARALGEPCWQLLLLANHAHPTVAYFARQTLDNRAFRYTGDPFEDLSVAHFMERFVYKKPKPAATATAGAAASSKMAAKSPGDAQKKRMHAKSLAPDSLAYKNLNADQVPSDERFIHSYFNFIDTKPPKERRDDDDYSSSDESAQIDDEFDAYLMKHEKGLIPNDLDEDEDEDADFNYSSDEELDRVDDKSTGKRKTTVKKAPSSEVRDDVNDYRDERIDAYAALESLEEEEDDDIDADEDITDEDDDDEEEEYSGPSSKSAKFDINKLFVSAEEIGDLYDTQDVTEGSKKKKSGRSSTWHGAKRGGNSRRSGSSSSFSSAVKRKRAFPG